MTTLFERDIPTSAMETVEDRVARITKRAARRGFPAPRLTKGATTMKSVMVPCSALDEGAVHIHTGYFEKPVPVEYTHVTITADGDLSLGGWHLAGVVAPVSDGEALISDVPGESTRGITIADAEYCDHCRTRRMRNETFIVRHDDGTVRQVGRDCLRDFLGHDPGAILAGLEAWRELNWSDEDVAAWGRSAPRLYPVEDIVGAAARVVTARGWYVSRRKAEEAEMLGKPCPPTTGEDTRWVLDPPSGKDKPADRFPVTPTVETLIADTMAGLADLRTKPVAALSDWEAKLVDYTAVAAVQNRHVGTVASAVILGLRKQERPAKAERGPADHLAPAGSRVKDALPARVTFIRQFGDYPDRYGVRYLVKLEAERFGLRFPLLWWASWTERVAALKVGDAITITGATVKANETDKYNGDPVTVLTRVAFAG